MLKNIVIILIYMKYFSWLLWINYTFCIRLLLYKNNNNVYILLLLFFFFLHNFTTIILYSLNQNNY